MPTRITQFENWHQWRPFAHQNNASTLLTKKVTHCDGIFASDKYQSALDVSEKNAIAGEVSFSVKKKDVSEITPPTKEGVIVCNPPYGLRLGENVDSVYRCLGQKWRDCFCAPDMNWKMVFLCPNLRLARLVDKRVQSVYRFSQGGLNVNICVLLRES